MRRGQRWSLLAALSLGVLASAATSTPRVEASADGTYDVAVGDVVTARFRVDAHVDGAYGSRLQARCCHTGGAPIEVAIDVEWGDEEERGGAPQRLPRATLGLPEGPRCIDVERALDCAEEGCGFHADIHCEYRVGDRPVSLRVELAGELGSNPGLLHLRAPARELAIARVRDDDAAERASP